MGVLVSVLLMRKCVKTLKYAINEYLVSLRNSRIHNYAHQNKHR